MPRIKRDTLPFNIKMDREIFERLDRFCEESGQTKTAAVERAVTAYINEYEAEQKFIKENMD